jgi:ABC-2 type transport system ATP-binding protein
MAVIVTEALTKYYGATPGIVDLDIEVQVGEVFGFLGPNGAGKSTTIRTLLHMLHPTSGTGSILGLDIRKDTVDIRKRIGYIPGDLAMYNDMTAQQLFEYFSSLRHADTRLMVEELAGRLQLDVTKKIGSYSSGNRQKVAIVQAFMAEPELLILDEPSGGLDPLMQQEFYRMVDEVKSEGRTVFLSSHILPEVERLADRVGIVRESRLVALETVAALREKAMRRLEIIFSHPVDVSDFASLPGVHRTEGTHNGRGIDLAVEGNLDQVMAVAGRHPIENIRSREGDLEEAFLAYYADDAVPLGAGGADGSVPDDVP